MATEARVICDSISENGRRLTTFELVMHRYVLAEFNTHRTFSRNSASSRAIPLRKQLERVLGEPAWPVAWPAEQKGMQGGAELDQETVSEAKAAWFDASRRAAHYADRLGALSVHKSVANRLLEPFMWHTVVVTATAYNNFFGLRNHTDAQPEIRVVAAAMMIAYDASEPTLVPDRGWHLPYIQPDELDMDPAVLTKISSARVARTSYLTHDGVRDVTKDLELFDRLAAASPMHASPFEHVATPYPENEHVVYTRDGLRLVLPQYGNFLGWHQLRFEVEAMAEYQAFQ